MRRPPSYSDSYIILASPKSLAETTSSFDLTAVWPPSPIVAPLLIEDVEETQVPENKIPRILSLFVLKSSLHIFLISIFETAFFFLFVSITENNGILKTIDTYYEPLRDACPQWSNGTRWALYEILDTEFNMTLVDSSAASAVETRKAYNASLLRLSIGISGGCLCVCSLIVCMFYVKGMKANWKGILIENFMMVVFLGLYEYFFFRGIIYNYQTISTPELNAYILDGLWSCVADTGG